MNQTERAILDAYNNGQSIKELCTSFNMPYQRIYRIVSSSKPSSQQVIIDRLLNEIIALKRELKEVKDFNNRLVKQIEETGREITDNQVKRLTIDNLFLKRKLTQVEHNYQVLKDEKLELLKQESKTIGWQAWRDKYDWEKKYDG